MNEREKLYQEAESFSTEQRALCIVIRALAEVALDRFQTPDLAAKHAKAVVDDLRAMLKDDYAPMLDIGLDYEFRLSISHTIGENGEN